MDVSIDGSTDGFAGRMEILEDCSGRRFRSEAERARIAAESLVPGVRVADVARRHEVTRWQVYDWRKKLKAEVLALPVEAATRKNALFAGHEVGAENWALLASLIANCKMCDVDPVSYLAKTLQAQLYGHPKSRIDELMPWNFKVASSRAA